MYVGTFKSIEFIATKRAGLVHLKALELHEGDQPVLGLHLLSAAGQIIQEFTAAFKKGLTIKELQKTLKSFIRSLVNLVI